MTPTQCVTIVELIDARCPSQRIAEQTADAWYYDLKDHTYDDALEAVLEISRTQPYVNLRDLVAEATKIRTAREREQRLDELNRRVDEQHALEDAELLSEPPPPEIREAVENVIGGLRTGFVPPPADFKAIVEYHKAKTAERMARGEPRPAAK